MTASKNTTVARVRKTAVAKPMQKAAVATVAPVKPKFRLVATVGDPDLIKRALEIAADRPSGGLAEASAILGAEMPSGRITTGEFSRLCYQGGKTFDGRDLPLARYGTSDPDAPQTPDQLIAAVLELAPGKGDNSLSWGRLAARFGITEGTARAAYDAGKGEVKAYKKTGKAGWNWRNEG